MDGATKVRLRDGVRLATYQSGTPTALPPVVLLHGGPGLWDYLGPLAEALNDITVTIRYDQRGCGASDPADAATLSMRTWLDDLADLRRRLGIRRWIVVGHSFGATIALAHAAERPDVVAGAALIDAVGVGEWQQEFRDAKLARTTRHARRDPDFGRRLTALSALGAERTLAEEMEWRQLTWSTDFADPAQGLVLAREMASEPFRINEQVAARVRFEDADVRGWAASVRCPVEVVHGARDPRPWRSARDLCDLLPSASWHLIDEAGHMPWLENPDAVAAILRNLVRRCR